MKIETNSIKFLVKKEIESEKDALQWHMTTIKKELVASRQDLIEQVALTQ